MNYHTVKQIDLKSPDMLVVLKRFLAEYGLKYEDDIDTAFGIFSEEGDLLGCGCAAGALLKCFSITSELQGQNGLGILISHLTADRFSKGIDDLFVITRADNLSRFSNCGFYLLSQAEEIIMLENRPNGIERFLDTLPHFPASGRIGAIVANCNPITNGHLALIRRAASQCDWLYLFVVQENRSYIPFADRYMLVQKAVEGIPNIAVCPSGPYIISNFTFPTYFLKDTEDPSILQSKLDISIFSQLIAPALDITIRFAGQEPFDPVTHTYNAVMRELLPLHGITFCEIPRAESNGVPISASAVRKLVQEQGGHATGLQGLVPPTTADYLAKHFPIDRRR